MFTKVPLTFLVFCGIADPVPKKTTSKDFSLCPADRKRYAIKLFFSAKTIHLKSRKQFVRLWSKKHPFWAFREENSPERWAAAVEQISLHLSTSFRKFGTSDASFTNSSVLHEGMASLTNEKQSEEEEEDTHHCLQQHWQGILPDLDAPLQNLTETARRKHWHLEDEVKKKEEESGRVQWSIPDCFLWQGSRVMSAKLGGLKDRLTFATPLRVWAGTWADTGLWRWRRAALPRPPGDETKAFHVFL